MGLEVALEGEGGGAGFETDHGFHGPRHVLAGVVGLAGVVDGEAFG